jgi:hypothetical protein
MNCQGTFAQTWIWSKSLHVMAVQVNCGISSQGQHFEFISVQLLPSRQKFFLLTTFLKRKAWWPSRNYAGC